MTRRPVIGIATQTQDAIPGQSPLAWVMGQKYVQALTASGAVPWIIPLLSDDEPTLRSIYERLDGIFLTGGVDVGPAQYGEALSPKCGKIDPPRDWTEIRLVQWAFRDAKPVLGVCRGMQVINVALGGSLFQDVATDRPASIKHDYFPTPGGFTRDRLVHEITSHPSSRLGKILGTAQVRVNSMHHQGVKKLAPELIGSVASPDGLVEGIEGTNGRFVVGVQWHPEELTQSQPPMKALFDAFTQAATPSEA